MIHILSVFIFAHTVFFKQNEEFLVTIIIKIIILIILMIWIVNKLIIIIIPLCLKKKCLFNVIVLVQDMMQHSDIKESDIRS